MALNRSSLTLALVCSGTLAAQAAAQSFAVDQGSLLIDGQASFTSVGFEVNGAGGDDRTSQLSITPTLQYFVMPGLALGGELTLARFADDNQSSWNYGIGPALTYYFGRTARPWYPYLGASLQFIQESNSADAGPDPEDSSFRAYKGAGGALFMISRAVGLNGELFYRFARRKAGNVEVDTDVYGLAVGVSAFVF